MHDPLHVCQINDVNFEEGLDVLRVWAIKRLALFIYPTSQLTPQLMILDTWAPSTCALCALCAAGRVQECSCHFLRHFTVLWHLISLHGGALRSQCHDMSKTYSQAKYSDFEEVKGSSRFLKNPTRYYWKCAYSFLNVYHQTRILHESLEKRSLAVSFALVSSKILEKRSGRRPLVSPHLWQESLWNCASRKEEEDVTYNPRIHASFKLFAGVWYLFMIYIMNTNSDYDYMWVK